MSNKNRGVLLFTFGLLFFFMFIKGYGLGWDKPYKRWFLWWVTLKRREVTTPLERIILGVSSAFLIIGGASLYFLGS